MESENIKKSLKENKITTYHKMEPENKLTYFQTLFKKKRFIPITEN